MSHIVQSLVVLLALLFSARSACAGRPQKPRFREFMGLLRVAADHAAV